MSTEVRRLPASASPHISVIIAAQNATRFLEHVFSSLMESTFVDIEVVVVDDCSSDDTAHYAREAGARVVQLSAPIGAAAARNRGAEAATAPLLFFTDHDCCFLPNTLARVAAFYQTADDETVLGGTYTLEPFDSEAFASRFQSVHVHYSETRKKVPDYIASHCLGMRRERFLREGGFPEHLSRVLPNGCCQDVLFSHLLRQRGYRLVMDPALQVRHIFYFTAKRSLHNAFWKSRSWTRVALGEKSLHRDSGSASSEMKASALCLAGAVAAVGTAPFVPEAMIAAPLLTAASVCANWRLYSFVMKNQGLRFTSRAVLLYTLQLLAVLVGGAVGLLKGPITTEQEL
jgi:glycosyltransferase involved in cell wall biosynthesis